jgi:hypothetical protein
MTEPEEGDLYVPDIPKSILKEYPKAYKDEMAPTDDERFDHALDFVMFHNDGLDEDDHDEHVAVLREWAYELMELTGTPYDHDADEEGE